MEIKLADLRKSLKAALLVGACIGFAVGALFVALIWLVS